MRVGNNWSDEAVAIVRREVEAGTPYSAISDILLKEAGEEKTRNAISGLVFRMGIGPTRPVSLERMAMGKEPVRWNPETDATLLEGHGQKLNKDLFIKLFLDKHDRYASWTRIKSRLIAVGVHAKVAKPAPAPRAPRCTTPEQRALKLLKKRHVDGPVTLPSEAELADAPVGSVSLLRTRRNDCKFPVGSDGGSLMVCGSPASVGAYCAKHAALAYDRLPTARRNGRFHAGC